jgi:dolichol-phosphate mannosyltransferase
MSKRTRSNKTPTKPASEATITHSVIVPAYKEKLNLRPLTTRLFAAFNDSKNSPIKAENVELIVVDDNSRDGSVEEVDVLKGEGYNVRIIVRTTERGLSSAVVRGFREAKGDAMICMDADLQVRFFLPLLFFVCVG